MSVLPLADRMSRYRLSSITLLICCYILINTRYAASLECYSCSNIEDINNCTLTVQCSVGHSCYQEQMTSGLSVTYTLGCIDNNHCGTHRRYSPRVMGRDLQGRQTSHCHECCSTDSCNKPLCEHFKRTPQHA
ncbi:uncharacterized protein LOC128548516 isoform X2 [Mercenaria mercenaria]|uniref:uncharacterized protein LOC128548516 isoform X2 n=1 Tax=Mercenaria mercenaria TaxID=6596 RepID=UPI00234F2BA6|nr:uncharacterized protein LOC128548516 isoform X2 [Mercenaria mercenaria]